jgi:hypothetical protein
VAPVRRALSNVAQKPIDDEAAKAELEEKLAGKEAEVVELLMDRNFMIRDSYLSDREYRLLAAVASKSEVEPMPTWRASLFSAEAELGSVPMDQAFHKLAQIEPRLLDIERRARLPIVGLQEHRGLPKSMREELVQLVGGAADGDDELLCTNLASSVVHQYLQALIAPTDMSPADVSYWAARHKVSVVSAPVKPPRNK